MEGKILRKYILTYMVLFAPFSKAEVSLKDASYANTWTTIVKGSEKIFNLNRKYNSRSLFNGLFGFGWCSNIEVRLQLGDEYINLIHCGQEYRFSSHKDIYIRLGANNEQIVAIEKGYEYWQKGQLIYKFGLFGQLTHIFQQGQEFVVSYPNSHLILLNADGFSAKLKMFKKFNKVKEVSSQNSRLLFSYLNENFVKLESKGLKFSEDLEYDDLHNLTQYKNTQGATVTIVYDSDNDQVVSYRDNNCTATYNFEVKETQPDIIYLSSEAMDCGAKTEFTQIQFHYELKDNKRVLATTQSLYQGQASTIHYHPKWGRPTLILSGKTKYTYSYDKLTGRLISKKQESLD